MLTAMKEPATRPGTVYLIAQPTIPRNGRMPDLSPLSEHGDIRVLIEAGDYPTFHPQKCLDQISSRLRDFNPETDYIVWAGGDTMAAVMTGLVLADLGFDKVRWLRHERGKDPKTGRRCDEGGFYTPIDFPLYPSDYVDPQQGELFAHEGAKEPA